jgi:hypothetical protein
MRYLGFCSPPSAESQSTKRTGKELRMPCTRCAAVSMNAAVARASVEFPSKTGLPIGTPDARHYRTYKLARSLCGT